MAFNRLETNLINQVAALKQEQSAEKLQLGIQLQLGQITQEELEQRIAQVEQKYERLIAAARQQNQTETADPKLD